MVFPADLCAHARWARFPASCMSPRRLTEPPRTCGVWGRIWKGSNSLIAGGAFLMLCDKGQRIRSPCWLGAAALSAAVTSRKPIGDTPNAQAEPSQKKSTPSNANRSSGEWGLGGEALLSEKRPLPPESLVRPHTVSWGGSAREGLLSEKPPPSHTLFANAGRSRRLCQPP